MVEDSRKVKIKNRVGNGTVGYTIPDMNNLTRIFEDGEEKIVTFEEIRKLSYLHGGSKILKNYLTIEDKEILSEINFIPEPEYFYTREDIIKLMQTGSLDEFLDCLDFAPDGVKETIKTLVELPLNDVAKRDAIQEKLGFNVNNAIENKKITEEDVPDLSVKPIGQRRAAARSNGDSNQSIPGKTSARRVIVKENK